MEIFVTLDLMYKQKKGFESDKTATTKTKKILLAYAVATTLGITGLTGCGKYETKKDSSTEFCYESLANYYILELNYENDNVYYVVDFYQHIRGAEININDLMSSKDIGTMEMKEGYKLDQSIITSEHANISISAEDFKFVKLRDYLVKKNNIKEKYNSDDINQILDSYKNEQEKTVSKESTTGKVLTKSKTN